MNQHHPSPPPDYWANFYAWTQHQAQALRSLQKLNATLPGGLDIPNLAEAIEDLGKSELRATISLIRQLLVHVVKAASDPQAPAVRHWRAEGSAFQSDLLSYYEPSMRQRINLQKIWTMAIELADADLKDHGASVASAFAASCPLSLHDITAKEFGFDEAVAQVLDRSGAP